MSLLKLKAESEPGVSARDFVAWLKHYVENGTRDGRGTVTVAVEEDPRFSFSVDFRARSVVEQDSSVPSDGFLYLSKQAFQSMLTGTLDIRRALTAGQVRYYGDPSALKRLADCLSGGG